jgi:hypothetical protein
MFLSPISTANTASNALNIHTGGHQVAHCDHPESPKIDVELIPIRNHPDEAGLMGAVHLALRSKIFSQECALIIQRFLKLKEWKNTERIVIGGASGQAGLVSWLPVSE